MERKNKSVKKQYQVSLDEEIVKQTQHQALDSKLSPIINSLLKIWVEYRDEVDKLFSKLKKN